MSFFKEVTERDLLNASSSSSSFSSSSSLNKNYEENDGGSGGVVFLLLGEGVPALPGYLPNSFIYTALYLMALPPNIFLLYMGLRPNLITSRVKFPTLGMTLANLFGLVGFLLLNFIYLYAVMTDTQLSLFTCSLVRTILYNTSYVCYFLFPVLAVDQYLFICQNVELKIHWLKGIVAVCFAIPMAVAVYDLWLQDVVLYDYMFRYIRMSLYTNMFFFLVLAPSFFVFSFICNILVLLSIVQRQSKTSRKQQGRSLNPRQLQQHKSIIYTYILQAFLPLALATPYYIACLCLFFEVDISLTWFVVGEGIIALHPLSNALITLLLLRPYREAFKKLLFRRRKQKQPQWPSPIQRLLVSAPPDVHSGGMENNNCRCYNTAIVTTAGGDTPFCMYQGEEEEEEEEGESGAYNAPTAVSL